MIELTPTQEARLDCLCGLCNHDCIDSKCIWLKMLDKPNPQEELKKNLLALIEDVVKKNTTGTRAKIKAKKG